MAQKIISVSISNGDKLFMRDKFLSPSKLLQERITQIRDEINPALYARIKEDNRKIDALQRKLGYASGALSKVCELAQTKINPKEWEKLIEKI